MRLPPRFGSNCLLWGQLAKLAVLGLVAGLTQMTSSAQEIDNAKILESCRSIQDSDARLRCFEAATSNLAGSQHARPPAGLEGWRLVRTPNPAGGKALVSIMHTADPFRSDPNLAGLMISCGEAGNHVLIALITPLPLRALPLLLLSDPSGGATRMEAKVLPPGALIQLPAEATELASGHWQTLSELSIQITNESEVIRGIIPLKGLAAGLQTLIANCPTN